MTKAPFQHASPLQGTRFIESGYLSGADRQALAEIATPPRAYKASIDFVSEGVRTDNVLFLTTGWACRYKTARNGARQITGFVVAGDICNLGSFMLAQVNFGVRTLTAATVVGMPRARLQALSVERPGIARAFAFFTIMENAILSEWALSLGRRTSRARLAHLLCEMAERLDGRRGNRAEFELPVTQEQIGDALGLTSVHINRTMQQLRAEGLIVAKNRKVIIADMAELRRVGGFEGSYLHLSENEDLDYVR